MILVAFIILYVGGYFIPEDMPKLYGMSYELIIVVLCLGNFIKTNYLNSATKATWFCCTLWTASNLIYFTWLDKSVTFDIWMFLLEATTFLSMIIYSNYKCYTMVESDEYNEEDCFIAFKRPRTFFDFIISALIIPVSSVSVVSKGYWYGYVRGQSFSAEKYTGTNDLLIKVDVEHSYVVNMLRTVIGSKWSLLNNCCHATARILNSEIGLYDALPCHFYKTVLKDESCRGKRKRKK